MKRIAIIDDGLHQNGFVSQTDLLQVCNYKMCKDHFTRALSHGTMCLKIMEQICPHLRDFQIISIKVLSSGRKGDITDLLIALNWCLNNQIKLIHFGVGTTNYHDFFRLKPLIEVMVDKGILLVAAYHNHNIPTWPACFQHVFGVRRDQEGHIQSGKWGIDRSNGLRVENALIANINQQYYMEAPGYDHADSVKANSFAAPVITGHMLNILRQEPDITFVNALSYFEQNSSANIFESLYCDYSVLPKGKVNLPLVIKVSPKLDTLISSLAEEFRSRGYSVEMFSWSDKIIDNIIPLKMYRIEQLTVHNVWQLESIYHSDIMLFSTALQNQRLSSNVFHAEVDFHYLKMLYKVKFFDGLVKVGNSVEYCCDVLEKKFT